MTEKIVQSPLFDKIHDYLTKTKTNDRFFFYVPYIKTKTLSKLLDNVKNKIIIITTWHSNDLLSGSSELELYQFCKENNITLYINNKIHLKVYSLNLETAIISSGNISQRGLMPEGNYEVGVFIEKLSNENRIYFEKIKNEAILVDDEIYRQYKEWYDKQPKEIKLEEIKLEEIITITQKENFLRSALPMTRDINEFIEGYVKINSGLEPSNDSIKSACIYHDLANYNLELGLSKEEFIKKLKIQFFSHPFIKKIDEFIAPEAYWGSIRIWIRDHCTDVPLPRPWELTENVQILYNWFIELGNGKYVKDVPGARSERIRKINL